MSKINILIVEVQPQSTYSWCIKTKYIKSLLFYSPKTWILVCIYVWMGLFKKIKK